MHVSRSSVRLGLWTGAGTVDASTCHDSSRLDEVVDLPSRNNVEIWRSGLRAMEGRSWGCQGTLFRNDIEAGYWCPRGHPVWTKGDWVVVVTTRNCGLPFCAGKSAVWQTIGVKVYFGARELHGRDSVTTNPRTGRVTICSTCNQHAAGLCWRLQIYLRFTYASLSSFSWKAVAL